jgi:hypothetical protein
LTTSWQRFSATGTISSSATQIQIYFFSQPTGTAGAADYFDITGVQLEVGNVATAFQTATGTIQGELAACQRYYSRLTSGVAYGVFPATGSAGSTTQVNFAAILPVRMRVRPTSIDYSGLMASDTVSAFSISNLTIVTSESTTDAGRLAATVSGVTQYRPYILYSDNNTAAYLGFSAEL